MRLPCARNDDAPCGARAPPTDAGASRTWIILSMPFGPKLVRTASATPAELAGEGVGRAMREPQSAHYQRVVHATGRDRRAIRRWRRVRPVASAGWRLPAPQRQKCDTLPVKASATQTAQPTSAPFAAMMFELRTSVDLDVRLDVVSPPGPFIVAVAARVACCCVVRCAHVGRRTGVRAGSWGRAEARRVRSTRRFQKEQRGRRR